MSDNNSCVSGQNETAEHVCLTFLKQASASMKWTIRNFILLQNESSNIVESSSFESVENKFSTGTWKIRLCPKYSNEDRIGLFFVCSENLGKVFVKAEAWIIDAEGKAANKKNNSREFAAKEFGFAEFIATGNLVESLLPNGNLTIHCIITVTSKNQTQNIVTKDENFGRISSLNQDFSKLLKDSLLSDAVLLCGDRKFLVHKCVLAARSSVFCAMFTHDFKEKEENLVEIKDIEADVLENLLSYIYTDKVSFTTDMAIKLVEGADKYNILELKEMCQEFMKKNVSILNLCEIAATADLHNLDALKEVCINFMSEHGSEIVFSDNSSGLFQFSPQFLLEGVFKQLFIRDTFQEDIPAEIPEESTWESE